MKASLGTLEVELLALIFEYVDDDSPKTTKAVACVNKYFKATSELVAHRRKSIQLEYWSSLILKKWLLDPAITSGLRHLEVSGKASHSSCFDLLAQLISRLGNLRTLTWNLPQHLPLDVLRALHSHHPKARLKVYNFTRQSATLDHTDPAELALSTSPALVAIKALILNDGVAYHPDLREAAILRLIAKAPNLKYACIIRNNLDRTHRSLEELTEAEALSEKFYTHKKPNSSVRTLTLDGYSLSKETLEEWSKFVDMSQLENLKCTRGVPDISYFKSAANIAKNLRHVSLNFVYYTDEDFAAAADNYIANCAPLETLSLWSWVDVIALSTILRRHGPTLKKLELHERENIHSDSRRFLLKPRDIKKIREACPALRDFTFDVNRRDQYLDMEKEEKNVKIYIELASFGPQLERVQLYFDLGIQFKDGRYGTSNTQFFEESDSSDIEDERLRLEQGSFILPSHADDVQVYLGRIWQIIFGGKKMGPRLLDVKFGEWERKMGRSQVPWLSWERRGKTLWSVKPEERDDMAGQCMVRMVQRGESQIHRNADP